MAKYNDDQFNMALYSYFITEELEDEQPQEVVTEADHENLYDKLMKGLEQLGLEDEVKEEPTV